MATSLDLLTTSERSRFSSCPVRCSRYGRRIESLADYISILSSYFTGEGTFWFRGHAEVEWDLIPSALRFPRIVERNRALNLLTEFKRVAELKHDRPPHANENMKWRQLAQHFGLPTRLLDWTESATFALYFACLKSERDGMVFVINPTDLNRLSVDLPRVLDAQLDSDIIDPYFELNARRNPQGRYRTIAINPVWNSDRIMMQRGVFTLHGSQSFNLNNEQAPSLVAVPILSEVKSLLWDELERIGVDEMTLFPELEHSCNHLRRKANL